MNTRPKQFNPVPKGCTSYIIATDPASAKVAGWIPLLQKVRTVLGPYITSKDAASAFIGIHTDEDKGIAGVHFYAKPHAAAAVLAAFPGYGLFNRDGTPLSVTAPTGDKKPKSPKP